jgi:hypothetical protein
MSKKVKSTDRQMKAMEDLLKNSSLLSNPSLGSTQSSTLGNDTRSTLGNDTRSTLGNDTRSTLGNDTRSTLGQVQSSLLGTPQTSTSNSLLGTPQTSTDQPEQASEPEKMTIPHLCHHVLYHPNLGRLKQATIGIIRNPNHRLFYQHMMSHFIPHFNDVEFHELYHYLTNHPIPSQYEASHETHYTIMAEILHRIITRCQDNGDLRQVMITLVQKVLHMPY